MVLITVLAATTVSAAPVADPTATALAHCLDDASNASTRGQTDCEAIAQDAYDRRMNSAYSSLMHRLPRDAAGNLRLSQRAWLAFRNSEAEAQLSLYETRRGTMYVPMQAYDTTILVRDRALQLEGYVRMMSIEP